MKIEETKDIQKPKQNPNNQKTNQNINPNEIKNNQKTNQNINSNEIKNNQKTNQNINPNPNEIKNNQKTNQNINSNEINSTKSMNKSEKEISLKKEVEKKIDIEEKLRNLEMKEEYIKILKENDFFNINAFILLDEKTLKEMKIFTLGVWLLIKKLIEEIKSDKNK
jgi:hypothetical protein